MYTWLLNLWANFRSSFWFVPSLMMLLATLSAFSLLNVDSGFSEQFVSIFPAFQLSPPAARSILASIVGAMVTSTGVVFSITIVALSLASSHFGSRLIRTYRNRISTQFTVGIFVSTSLFCILVMASIREIEDFSFVPNISVLAGILLAVVCLMTLVYYIHDMSKAIQAPQVIQSSADDLHESINRMFPTRIGDPTEDAEELEDHEFEAKERELGEPDLVVKVDCVGYLQAVQTESILGLATTKNLVIRLRVQPGDFLFEQCPVADVWIRENGSDAETREQREQQITKSLRNSLIVGPERTHIQDVRHAFDELVDIAVRALSPGINDPFTAVNCVDRLQAALLHLKARKVPSRYRLDEDQQMRIVATPVTVDECIDRSLRVINSYADDAEMVRRRISEVLQMLERS